MKYCLIAVIFGVLLAGCAAEQQIGGQRDEYGCLGPAGYSYDQDVGACTRNWEIKETQIKQAAKMAVDYAGAEKGLTVIDVAVLKCPGCFIVELTDINQATKSVEILDWTVIGEYKMTEEEAMQIAEASACTQEGPLKNSSVYNPNTKTWWIDLDINKPGCMPACVVYEETKTAEINWRCTGAIAPITNFDECIEAGNPVMESYPRQCKAGDRTFIEEI